MYINTCRVWGAKEIRLKEIQLEKENPLGEEFIIEKCAAVQYRRAQHIKELIFDQGMKENVWEDSDNMF